jgi:hypothetical protein
VKNFGMNSVSYLKPLNKKAHLLFFKKVSFNPACLDSLKNVLHLFFLIYESISKINEPEDF